MKRKGITTINVGIIALVMLLSVIILGAMVGGGATKGTFLEKVLPEPKNQVECDVTLEREWWGVGGVKIKTVATKCAIVDTCYFRFATAPFITVMAKEGTIRMYSDTTLDDQERYEVGLRQTKTYTLSQCIEKGISGITIKLVDEEGVVIEKIGRML